MHRLTIIFLFSSTWAFASTITGPVPIMTTACMIGGSPVSCGTFSSPNRFGQYYWVGADTFGGVTGLGTTGLSVYLQAEATSSIFGLGTQASADAFISLDFLGSTDGPQRQGFATYQIITEGDHGSFAGALPIGSIAGLGNCQGYNCQSNGLMVPVELGTPFEVTASVHAQSCCDSGTGAGGDTAMRLHLFELDGTPVTILNAVPEPSTWVFVALGLITLWTIRAKASC